MGSGSVYDHWLKEEFRQGVDVFRRLAEPTPADRRWAGLCFTELGQLFEAELQLVRHTDGEAAAQQLSRDYARRVQRELGRPE